MTDDDSSVLSSRLLRTELTRVLRGEDVPVSRRDEILDFIGMIPLTAGVLTEAEAIVPHIKTLDAIHLGSLIRTGIDAVIVTHDATMRDVGAVIGYDTFDPVMY